MPDIDKMSLKELRAMLKEKRKTALLPVSKMKKGALMKELVTPSNLVTIGDKYVDPPSILMKKTANQIVEKSQKDKRYVPMEGYTYGAEEITRPGAKRFARVTGKVAEGKGGFIGKAGGSERLYSGGEIVSEKRKSSKTYADTLGNQTIQQPLPVDLGKKSLAQTDQPGSAGQATAPKTKRQSAKKTMKSEVNEPVGASNADIESAMVVKRKPGRPPKNMGHRIGAGQAIPSSLAPPHLVISESETYEQQQMRPNLTLLRKEKPMKYGGGFVELLPPKGQVAKEVVKIEEKKKKVLSEEHKRKMQEGRLKAKKDKEGK